MAMIMKSTGKKNKKGEIKVEINPHLKEISKIVKSKNFKSMTLTKKGRYNQLSAGLEIGWDPKDPKEYALSFLFVPDMKEEGHEHIDIDVESMKKLHGLIGNILKHVKALPKKKKK